MISTPVRGQPPSPYTPPAVLTPKQFHEAILGAIGLNTVYELLRAGRLKHVRIGNRYLILASEVTAFWEREADSQDEAAS